LVMECVADAMGWISREENIGRGLTGWFDLFGCYMMLYVVILACNLDA
jgi:hypothetical protein